MGKKIKNPPLVEFLFEIKFKSPDIVDYDLLIGELFSKLKDKYPINESLKPKEVPSMLFPFNMSHRFRKTAGGYPLYQIGPGIASFNMDGATYSSAKGDCWENFKKELMYFLKVYKGILGDKFKSENFEYFKLRTIDKIEDSTMYPKIKPYFSDKLGLSIDLSFAKSEDYIERLDHNQLVQVYDIDKDKKTQLQFAITTITEGSRKLILDLSMKSKEIPPFEGMEKWLDEGHTRLEDFFKKITKKIWGLFD